MWKSIYNQKITILNKLRQSDSGSGIDEWYKTSIDGVAWYKKSISSMQGSTAVMATTYKILIPFVVTENTNTFLAYKDWVKTAGSGSSFTLSLGDYIVLGDVEEEVTAKNIISIVNKYKPEICKVCHFQQPHKRFDAYVQFQIEGV